MTPKKISLIVPIYNEEKNITPIYEAIVKVWESLPTYTRELIFVNDGSHDHSAKLLTIICESDPKTKYIEFSRNFGKEMATTAGIHKATGDAVIMLDADLQHPPKYIPQMIEAWERGVEVVIGVRISNRGEGLIKKWGSQFFYFIMKSISETKIERGETDFRLLDRSVIEAYKTFYEHERMTRSLINWLGFKREKFTFAAPARQNGEAAYSTFKLIHLALNSFLSHSLLPLRLAGYLGVSITLFSGFLGVLVIIEKYILNDPLRIDITGSAQLAILTVFLIGIVMASLGIIGLYVGSIHTEVSGRPLYVIRKKKNF